ncbi:MAG: OadG family transporter subunit [Desulfuromonadaceae bacterium]|nr:OadG family transporter subunit [Desulfuromonadaceae bacterium]MDD2853929.1 OadG family transporter subunit [Desulfuromonadaceae bacterium]
MTKAGGTSQAEGAASVTHTEIFKVLDDGTVLYKTYQQAAAAKQLKISAQSPEATRKLSQVKSGENYLSKEGQIVPYTLASLVEFQFTGLIVVLVVLVGLSLICSLTGRLIRLIQRETAETLPPTPLKTPLTQTVPVGGIHPGLTDQQLVVILTAAATAIIGEPVRITRFRQSSKSNRGENWSSQGRSELQAHRLK